MKAWLSFVMLFVMYSSSVSANDLIFQYNSPSFNGNGYSSHVLGIYQLELNAKQKIQDAQTVANAQAAALKLQDPVYQFMTNLNAMVYQQLAKQITDTMFGQSNSTGGTVNFQGTTITWNKNLDSSITLTITENSRVTSLTVPAGTFKF
jgi:hypothetical protein